MKPVLLDTGCLVAAFDRSENHHGQVREALNSLEPPFLTCEAVIAEACHLLRGVSGAVDRVLENIERGYVVIPLRLTDQAARVRKLIAKYKDMEMDLADACLVDLATQMNSGHILTLDGDFRVYRRGRNKPFELVSGR